MPSTAPGTSLRSTRAMLSLSAVGAGDALGVVTSTHSNSQSMPSGSSTAATSARVSAAVISGRMRQSMQASARVGMTFTALPASSMVGVNVAPSRGSTSEATSGSSIRSSAPAARAVCGSLRRARSAGVADDGVDELRGERRDDGRRVVQAEGDHGARQVDDRAVLLLGHRGMPAAAARADAKLGEGLLAGGQQEDLAAVHRQPQAAHALR